MQRAVFRCLRPPGALNGPRDRQKTTQMKNRSRVGSPDLGGPALQKTRDAGRLGNGAGGAESEARRSEVAAWNGDSTLQCPGGVPRATPGDGLQRQRETIQIADMCIMVMAAARRPPTRRRPPADRPPPTADAADGVVVVAVAVAVDSVVSCRASEHILREVAVKNNRKSDAQSRGRRRRQRWARL